MIFKETKLKGAYIIEIEPIEDERGFFARSWCKEEFESIGLNPNLKQCNISYNKHKGTIRGMHFQTAPYEEAKLVRCIRGAIYDVIIDLREHSETFMKWIGVEITAENRKALYIPEGFAHGFQTIEENSEVFYQMSESYHAEHAAGIKWNDTTFGIEWPLPIISISDKDNSFQSFKVK
ncbi:dTDP-4-dehydrorhamnose 3,5-epimerase [Clostridium sp. UBA4548]|uniref:dTDP-4-dehydrorhamnose 3,5-epimerase n=1 Tax=Clostridium sp. UBA4548 TaxID=1946361 RepID=UPI0025BFAA6A|nr:dTDP-4-dehydrorhamnose 3,5-epimerase [Clostridium sp. UBA4548]